MFFFFHINLASCRYFLIAEPQIHAANTMHRIVVILGNVLPAHCFWRPYTVSQVTGGQWSSGGVYTRCWWDHRSPLILFASGSSQTWYRTTRTLTAWYPFLADALWSLPLPGSGMLYQNWAAIYHFYGLVLQSGDLCQLRICRSHKLSQLTPKLIVVMNNRIHHQLTRFSSPVSASSPTGRVGIWYSNWAVCQGHSLEGRWWVKRDLQ